MKNRAQAPGLYFCVFIARASERDDSTDQRNSLGLGETNDAAGDAAATASLISIAQRGKA
jgi:hypothetical protein